MWEVKMKDGSSMKCDVIQMQDNIVRLYYEHPVKARKFVGKLWWKRVVNYKTTSKHLFAVISRDSFALAIHKKKDITHERKK